MKRAILSTVQNNFNYNCPVCGIKLDRDKIVDIAGEVKVNNGIVDFTNTSDWLYLNVLCKCNTLVFVEFMELRNAN